jgi:methionyl-tRNA synthetase
MTNKYFGGTVNKPCKTFDFDEDLRACARDAYEKYTARMDDYHNCDAVEAVMNFARRCNKYVDETMPWALAKDESEREHLAAVMYNLLEGIRLLAVMLTPIMPSCAEKILAQINSTLREPTFGAGDGFTVGAAEPLFARIDAEKMLAEIEAELAANQPAEEEEAENIVLLPEIGIEDFAKVELRAAKITACEPIKKAKKLLKLTLEDGTGTPRTVASGIAQYYTLDELVGRTIVLVANLKPATLCGVESQGMILAADSKDGVKVIFLDGIEPGAKIR